MHRRRALISVSDKTGLADFARTLATLEFEIISTGGTAAALWEIGISVTEVGKVTGFPELMNGRVKTLHPKIHGGLLARKGVDDEVLRQHGIDWIDLLVVNLYPFERTVDRQDCTDQEAIENIDVGGPAMLRAGAKNHERVTVVSDPADYARVLEAVNHGPTSDALRRELAAKAFAHTARYDALISQYLARSQQAGTPFSSPLVLGLERDQELRYGENPHQQAALYRPFSSGSAVSALVQLQGKPLSYNNLLDADAALTCIAEFTEPACVIVKHTNPCGVAIGADSLNAYELAYRTDPASAFGGVIALNRPLDVTTAAAILERQFVELILVPDADAATLARLRKKPGVRLLSYARDAVENAAWELRSIQGGLLMQQRDREVLDPLKLRVVTEKAPTPKQLRDLRFAWSVAKHVKSNAIVYAKNGATLGIGAGQTSRVMSARVAGLKARDEKLSLRGAVMASDAFFPFRDGLDVGAKRHIRAVIQPGGSMRDEEVIEAANEHGIAMVFTGVRHFRH